MNTAERFPVTQGPRMKIHHPAVRKPRTSKYPWKDLNPPRFEKNAAGEDEIICDQFFVPKDEVKNFASAVNSQQKKLGIKLSTRTAQMEKEDGTVVVGTLVQRIG